MPSNSKRTAKTKRKRTGESAVKQAKVKVKKTKKRKKKPTPEELAAKAAAALNEVEENKKEDQPTKTTLMPVELITHEELEKITRENSFMLNPMLANASLQKDLAIASSRTSDLQKLHDHLFDVETLNWMDDKTKVSLYAVAVQDHHKTMAAKIKIAELSDKNRILRDVSKYYAELEKQKEIEATDTSHTSAIIQALLSESMRHAMDDEIQKKWGGSNSYRPPENTDFEILAIDENADE